MKCDEPKLRPHAILPNGLCCDKGEATDIIMKLKAKNERLEAKLETVNNLLKASRDMMDGATTANRQVSSIRERGLKRALWVARANSAEGQFFYWCARFGVESGFTKADIRGYSVNTKRRLRTIGEWIETWKNVRHECLKKAEEYR